MTKDFVYLASASPRRRELLQQLGVRFELRPANIDERRKPSESPAAYVSRLAQAKATEVWESAAVQSVRCPVLGADTAVVLEDRVLGKPDDEQSALRMLTALSGRCHVVLTGVAVRFGAEVESVLSTNEVRFRATTAAERLAYCRTGEPFGKAGGYGIQGLGAVFIEQLKGSYSAVMGLPLCETAQLLRRFGVPFWLTAEQDIP